MSQAVSSELQQLKAEVNYVLAAGLSQDHMTPLCSLEKRCRLRQAKDSLASPSKGIFIYGAVFAHWLGAILACRVVLFYLMKWDGISSWDMGWRRLPSNDKHSLLGY